MKRRRHVNAFGHKFVDLGEVEDLNEVKGRIEQDQHEQCVLRRCRDCHAELSASYLRGARTVCRSCDNIPADRWHGPQTKKKAG